MQINIKQGTDEYFLAKNVDWQDQTVDKILLFVPQSSGVLSPLDGVTPVLTRADIEDLYFDLYDKEEHTICNGMHYTQLLYTNNHPHMLRSKLQFNLSRMYFAKTPQTDGCILMYIFYAGKEEYDCEMPNRSVTIKFPLQAGEEITFTRLINTYIHAPGYRVKGITFWNADANPAYITMRDHECSYVINNLATPLCKPQMAGATAEDTQVQPMLLDNIDIDFDYSYIRNATAGATVQTMEIKY